MRTDEKTNIVDIMKLFFAICIVGIHTGLLNELPDRVAWYIMHLVFRLGVPFFFVTSGYFFGKKVVPVARDSEKRMSVCRRYVRKNLPTFLFWSIIGLLWYTRTLVYNQSDFIILRLVRTAIFYPQGAMWFVLASMVAVCIICLLWNHKKILVFLSVGGTPLPCFATHIIF